MMIVFFALAAYLVILAPLRMWAAVHLMTHYNTDEYLSNPNARKVWIFHFGSALTIGPVVLMATYLSGIGWVEIAGWVFCVLVTLLIAQKIKMRLDGSYREFYKAMQWR